MFLNPDKFVRDEKEKKNTGPWHDKIYRQSTAVSISAGSDQTQNRKLKTV